MTDAAPIVTRHRQSAYPARSKMLDMYAADITRKLTEGQLESAELAALAIPHIAVALADANLQSSAAAYEDWCTRWVQPGFDASVYEAWRLRSSQCERDGVPFLSLRALRLQRRAREVPSPRLRQDSTAEPGTPQAVSAALLRAERRWYEQQGRYEPLVQTNLARLGVLR